VVSAARCAVVGALLLAGCVKVNPADGAFVCGGGMKCPDNYYCAAANNTCWHNGHPFALDMSAPDLLPPSCTDGISDGNETDVDCGGPACPPCKANQACAQPSDCSTGSCLGRYCQLVSDSPKWIATGVPPLGAARADFAGFVTSDGLLMSVGGAAADGSTSDAVMDYKIGAGNQKSYTAIPHARYGHAGAVGPDGRFYAIGGCTSSAGCTTAVVDAFDYATNTWSSPAAPAGLNVGRRHAASAYAGGKLWVFGGFDGTNVLGSIEVYNPGSPDSWTKVAPLIPTPRSALAAVTGADDRVYTIGGGDGTRTSTPSLEIFDPKTTQWTAGANMSISRISLGAVAAPDGRIYAIAGSLDQSNAYSSVEAYTPSTNTWVPVAALSVPRLSGVALVGPDNRIYFMGGYTVRSGDMGSGLLASAVVEVYGPAMTVAPRTGTAGATNVSISGSNFAAGAMVDVFFGDRASGPVASGSTDGNGNLSAPISFIIPGNAPSGSAQIFAVDRKSQYPAVTTFLVQ
jgi:hypothetical protein